MKGATGIIGKKGEKGLDGKEGKYVSRFLRKKNVKFK